MSDRLQEAASGRTGPKTGFNGWIGGRARRREYWIWIAPLVAVGITLEMMGVPGASLIIGLPILFVWIRRLHDLGRSGWIAPLINVGVNFTSFGLLAFLGAETGAIGAFVLYVVALTALGVIPGQPKSNAYGPPPGRLGEMAETFS
jgi:uncharacterized membrane protein YhaH (DUF805 family)